MDEFQSFSELLAGLKIADCNSTEQHQATLTAAIHDVIQAISVLSRMLAVDKDDINTGNVAQICSLRTKANQLASVAHAFNEAVQRSIAAKVISMGGYQGNDIKKLLKHFDTRILAITKKVVGESKDDADVLWRIAEECYDQAVSSSGKLDPDDYFVLREESYPESPYDSQLESEEYYEHENRLDFDEEYAELCRRNAKLREQRHDKWTTEVREIWIRFWAQVLGECPGGPTLFHPPERLTETPTEWRTKDVPRYLFRAFDSNSTGRSNHNVVTSVASMNEASGYGRIDLLSLKDQDASDMLHGHLDKGLVDAGLWTLYPEFDFNAPDTDVQARKQWTKRVLQLRQRWNNENATTNEEVEWAVKIAKKCFGSFDDSDIALLLLGFKDRKFQSTDVPDKICTSEPVEVCRYMNLARIMEQIEPRPRQFGFGVWSKAFSTQIHGLVQDTSRFKLLFSILGDEESKGVVA
ncbi:hypothetical protein FSARC_10095 [Fusarium sarcochroum]|uniref:Uncharacterized protein n=1 Tax=Fusarium sarcochroum TaxID=1208366 RepID=A0A8H4TQ10_9HYPO|nr:hypothetical protein FSARC_10095 [Fusarium sarcochroum]